MSAKDQMKADEFRIETDEQIWLLPDSANACEQGYQSIRGMIEYH